ncbi:MAG: PQQ-binding-like beta-propeller repeat protein [Acidobacteria bacterium]|nr:PQQ-binding-like beta-propeller repeat protein [Acidobacteriota bacterium]MBI3470884.1 PQQ-binding-like beta-propeller repeat protein [Candidatus Solibacter usitatus]
MKERKFGLRYRSGNEARRVIKAHVVAGVVFTAAVIPLLAQDWPMWGGTAQRNMASAAKNLPETWDVKTGKNIKWKAQIGTTSYGNPVVAGGKIFLGTNNGNPRNPAIQGDQGVLMCFQESDGKFLWQAVTDKLASGPQTDFPEQGVCSSPAVEGRRAYYVSNRGELVCLDTEGFLEFRTRSTRVPPMPTSSGDST